MTIRQMGVQFYYADLQTDRKADMTKLVVVLFLILQRHLKKECMCMKFEHWHSHILSKSLLTDLPGTRSYSSRVI